MSIYPDWIGVDVSTGGIIIVEGHLVEYVDEDITVSIDSEIEVVIENDEVNVEYGD